MPSPFFISHYFTQAQLPHSHTSQLQVPLSQLGQAQSSHPQELRLETAQHSSRRPAEAFAGIRQPQLPHSQTSQVQTPPLQSAHRHSVQPHEDLPCEGGLELAKANVRPKVIARIAVGIKKRFMIKLQTER